MYQMILATETHRVPADMDPSFVEACKYLLDMDLGVLARPWAGILMHFSFCVAGVNTCGRGEEGAGLATACLVLCSFHTVLSCGLLLAEYNEYTKQIRQEYSFMSKEAFRDGRTRVMSHLLSKPQLYETDLFRGAWEARARHNVETELRALIRMPLVT